MLRHISELQDRFPRVEKTRPSEWHSPCPFCTDGSVSGRDGVVFYGEDRLIWFLEDNVFVCRRCKESGRGRGGRGLYTLTDVGHFFGLSVDISAAGSYEFKRDEVPLRGLWSDEMVEAAHRAVQRPFFYQFGWTDATIDRFRLGYGRFRGAQEALHIIPMRLERVIKHSPEDELGSVEGWYIATRGADRPYRSSGSVFNHWWHIVNNPESAIVLLAEGEKDAVSLAQLFPEYNVVTAWGASSWTPAKTELLARRYRELWVFGDADDAGCAFNQQVAAQARSFGLICRWIDWPNDAPDGQDVTDLLAVYGEQARERLLALLAQEEVTEASPPAATGVITLEELRGTEHPMSIRRTLEAYIEHPDGRMLLLAAPPGAGKTHALVALAERIAREVRDVRFAERVQLMAQIDELTADAALDDEEQAMLERLRRRLEHFSVAEIAWFGQYRDGFDDLLECGADPQLWYNYQARSEDNCRNFILAQRMGQQNHDVGKFCATACQFREQCEQNGYLAQENQRRERPITFFRHEHLVTTMASTYHRLVVIDENPCDIYDSNPLVVVAEDVQPHDPNWKAYAHDVDQAVTVELFASVLRAVVAQPPTQGVVSGAEFLDALAFALKAKQPDVDLATLLDSVDERVIDSLYHPNYLPNGTETVKKRCLKNVLLALRREVPLWLNGQRGWPTCLHLTPNGLEVYQEPKLRLLRRVPLIAADATAMPDLYEILFRRPVQVYRPQLFNPNAVITVVHGSDYTKTTLNHQLGDALQSAARVPDETITLLGEVINLDTLVDPDTERFTSRVMRDVKTAVDRLSLEHQTLLVITHKALKNLVLTFDWPHNVYFGHYGALRGSNIYADVEAVLLIGAFRVPYDVIWRKVNAWLALRGETTSLPNETHIVNAVFPNTNVVTAYRTFLHPFAAAYVDMVEVGELIQSAERIRPHSTTQRKYIYVLANRPALPYTTQVIKRSVFFNAADEQSTYNQALNYVLAFLEQHHAEYGMVITPTYKDLAQRYKLSNRDISRILRDARSRYEERLKREAQRLSTSGS